jgi:sulfane dehydrogenase subunit SoxC
MRKKKKSDRRNFLALGLSAATAAGCKKPPEPSESGANMRPYGQRSSYEHSVRALREPTKSPGVGSSRTPLQDLYGSITPSSLHFERHHSGVPQVDPAAHRLLLHGLIERPMVFTIEEIRRFPSVSRIYFLECGGNSTGEQAGNSAPDAQQSHGLLSSAEWTGVPLPLVLREAGLKPEAKWMIAEGADAGRMARSIPIEKALDDALLVYGQNGEALRPEQGYPLRLLLPGWEGNANVKWLHRLHFTTEPAMSVKETANYTELMPDGKAQIFTFVMEARSVITKPSGGQKLSGGGFHEISGLAWSGRGKITRVEVSINGGSTWGEAELQTPVLSKAATRFRFPWRWDGQEAVIQSRCTDETGYLQPTRDEIVAVRGLNSGYHYNGIKSWRVRADGTVTHV